ncbi:sensor histidine kinase, partial [Actinoplanes sp. GCM10030250]|uniref:sensor histidine kinase n=1 Tax=Actinoplanes sp. GCM10030250 TaxID=3273376 RepID=UPI00361C6670
MARWRIWLVPALLAAAQMVVWPGARVTLDPFSPVRVIALLAIVIAITAALCLRRHRPVVVLAVVTALITLGGWLAPEQLFLVPGDTLLVVSLADLVALFSVAVLCSRRTTALAVAGLVLWQVVHIVVTGSDPLDILAGAAAYGIVAASGRIRQRWLADRAAAARRLAEAEQARLEAADTERRRLARELHDVTAHHLTSVVVQASAAQFLGDQRPDLRVEALAFAARTGREALADLRRLVSVLPHSDGVPEAVPSLADLADDFRQLGQVVVLESDSGQADPGAVHGITREALTNTLRYAPGSTVLIRLSSGPAGTELLIEDDGPAAAEVQGLGGGRGLAGMRERAAAVGGTIETGPREGGGWRVHAKLPLTSAPPRKVSLLRSQAVLDGALALLTLALPLTGVATFAEETGAAPGATALLLLAVLAHAAPLLWRRRYPWSVFAAVTLTTWLGPLLLLTNTVRPEDSWLFLFSIGADLAAVYAVASRGARPGLTWLAPLATLACTALTIALLVVMSPPVDGEPEPGPLMSLILVGALTVFSAVILCVPVIAAWLAGHATRRRRRRLLDREEGAVLAVTAEAELHTRDERARVAAGLHAAVLEHAARVPRAADAGDLPGVVEAGRDALTAMRALLDGLGPIRTPQVSSPPPSPSPPPPS